MKVLLHAIALVVTMSGCFLVAGGDGPDDHPGGSGSNQPPPPPPPPPRPPVRGKQTMSDVHLEPSGNQVWIIHSAVDDVNSPNKVTTAHFGAYVPASATFVDVLDTTGTLGKKILFPANDRVLLVTQRGTSQDVYVTVDTVARRPVKQHTYPGDRTSFAMSPSGRAVVSINKPDAKIRIVDTASLVDQELPGPAGLRNPVWAHDVLYAIATNQAGTSTQVLRFDLRTADLAKPIAQPQVVTTIPGRAGPPVVSPDDRFLALSLAAATGPSQIMAIDLAMGSSRTIVCDSTPAFTNDNRLIVWQEGANLTHELRFVAPDTGVATAPVVVDYQFPPSSTPLRRHDLMIANPFPFEDKPAFLYGTTSGARTPMARPVFPTTMFERPGHDELWIWDEYDDTLERLDLATGAVSDLIGDVDSVDFRAAADDIVVGTFDHSVRRFSMATTQYIGAPLVLADPNDAAAPYKLTTD